MCSGATSASPRPAARAQRARRGRARERIRRWLREDDALAKAVAAWQARLAPMAEAVQPVAPPARLWGRIENQIEPALVAVALLLPLQRAGIPASYVAVLSDPKTNRPVLIATAQRDAMVLKGWPASAASSSCSPWPTARSATCRRSPSASSRRAARRPGSPPARCSTRGLV